MATITYTIPDGKIERIKAALSGLHSIPQIEDPENQGEMIDEFTPNQWAKECPRRWIRDQVARWEQKVARDAILYNVEDDIIT